MNKLKEVEEENQSTLKKKSKKAEGLDFLLDPM